MACGFLPQLFCLLEQRQFRVCVLPQVEERVDEFQGRPVGLE